MPSFLLSFASLRGFAGASTLLHGDTVGDDYGTTVSDAGDVDGDGYDDLLVGAPGADAGAGRVLLYLGGPSGPSMVPALILYGDPQLDGPNGTELGEMVSRAGDVNGDGFDDVAIVAGGPGLVYVYHGSTSGLSATASTTFGGFGFLGTMLADAGDVNGDGYDDLLVGARGSSHYLVSGRAFLHLGSAAGIDPVPLVTWTGGEDYYTGSEDYRLGDHISGAGDVNGDGYDDVLVTVGPGDVHLYAGLASGPGPLPTQVWTAPSDSPNIADVCGTDVNGDGYDDVVIGVLARGGAVLVYSGSSNGVGTSPSSSVQLASPWSLSRAGDVNADGFGDVVVGAPYVDDEHGRVEILVGSAEGLRRHPWSVIRGASSLHGGTDQGDRVGWSVSTALDLNHDGFDDVVVGGPESDGNVGQALAVSGHPDLTVGRVEVSVSDGVSVDVSHAAVGTLIKVRVTRADDPTGRTRVIGQGYANAIGEVHVEGSLPAGVTDGTPLTVQAFSTQDWSGWTLAEQSGTVEGVAAP